ncbi:hypothetical protein GCM10010401_10630 [Rarobacter faecitabidus]|uniref:TetR family transcriptional regulator n=1 Tax=Rarobacter faecitabidus TaxID=13243 RepID=A0A542ZP93_RARFA|nr:TetR/AcrR family transcriptional regulator [Rarobacter faecitabidus]TQL62194.1 TetR family transcriptional regulator [Rarobacter faecitabidus]
MTPYISPLREAQAAQTRRRVLDAAVAVFSEKGYSGASLALIAKRADVSVETVKQHGPKAPLLIAAFGHAFTRAVDDTPLHQRSDLENLRSLPDDEFLPGWMAFVAEGYERSARLWPRVLEAAAVDPAVGTRLASLQANRRSDMESVIAHLRDRGLCRSSRDDGELASVISFLISPESYTQLVDEGGMSQDTYRDWIVHAIERLILTD